MREHDLTSTVLRDSQSRVVRTEDLIKLFSLRELFTELGRRLQPTEDAGTPEASRWVLSKIVELRNIPEE